jgi:hypothetical protein
MGNVKDCGLRSTEYELKEHLDDGFSRTSPSCAKA